MNSVFIIDDHDIVRLGLEVLFAADPTFHVLGSASNLSEGLVRIAQTRPDLVVTDLAMRDSRGLETVRAVVEAQQERSVLVISMHDEMLYGEQAVALGARGYLMKENAHTQAVPAAREILAGRVWMSPALTARVINRLMKRTSKSGERTRVQSALTTRELEVLELLAKGRSTKQVAFELEISARTVDIHRANIKRKMGLRSGTELIAFALSRV